MKKIKIISIENDEINEAIDSVAEERTINIFVNGNFIDRVQCSPVDEEKLVYGYLFTEKHINSINDVKRLYFETQKGEKNFYAEIERSTIATLLRSREIETPLNNLFNLMNTLLEKSIIFRQTGGVHISGLSDGETLVSSFEDVSRRSTIQKTIGDALMQKNLQNIPFLLTTARVNEIIVQYAHRAGVRIIASHSAPTNRAVEKAESACITLVGFLRRNRMNIYSIPERIIF